MADSDNKLIKGVAIMQIGPAKGHTFKTMVGGKPVELPLMIDATTLAQVAKASKKFKNGVKVKDGHDGKMSDYVGKVTNFSVDGDTLRGDLTLNTSQENGAAIHAAISDVPDNFGLSAYFSGLPEVIGNEAFARCEALNSVDFEPETAATPEGMFRVGTSGVDIKLNQMSDTTNYAEKFAQIQSEVKACLAKMESDMEAFKAQFTAKPNPPGQTAQMGEIQTVVAAAAKEAVACSIKDVVAETIKLSRNEMLTEISSRLGLKSALPNSALSQQTQTTDVKLTQTSSGDAMAKWDELVSTTLKNGQAKNQAEAVQFCYKNYPNEAIAMRFACKPVGA